MEETTVDLIGDGENNELVGSSSPELIQGLDGDDTLVGNTGDDTLEGGEGDDLLNGALPEGFSNEGGNFTFLNGDDSLDGGAGNDTLITDLSDFGDTLRGGADNDTLIGAVSSDGSTFVVDDFSNDVGRNLTVFSIIDVSEVEVINGASLVAGATFFRGDLQLNLPTGARFTLDMNATPEIAYSFIIQLALNGGIDIGVEPQPGETLTPANDGNVDLLIGGPGDDSLTGGAFPNDLRGGDGDDTLRSINAFGDPMDTLQGEGGNDQLFGATRDDMLFGGFGGDFLFGGRGADTLDGGAGSNILSSTDERTGNPDGEADVFIIGALSEATLVVGFELGLDQLDLTDFGLGTLSIAGDLLAIGEQRLEGFVIDDALGEGHRVLLLGAEVGPLPNPEDEIIDGTPFDDEIDGFGGNDFIRGGSGNDGLSGGPGEDTIEGGGGNDNIEGGRDDDMIDGGAGDDVIIYEDGDGSDVIDGGADDDLLLIRLSNTDGDEIEMDGDGVLVRSNLDPFVLETQNVEIIDIDFRGGTDRFSSQADVTLTLRGGDGDDTLEGGFGDDLIIGGAGSDLLTWRVGQGDDILFGGDGQNPEDVDQVILTGSGAADAVTATAGFGFQGPTLTFTSGGQSETVTFSQRDQITVRGEGGNDRLDIQVGATAGGSLTIDGGTGNDTILGSGEGDAIQGGNGADDITGAGGDDTLTGGVGSDLFIFEDGFGFDEITDFNANDFLFVNLSIPLIPTFTEVGPDTFLTFEGTDDGIIFRDRRFTELSLTGRAGTPIARDDEFAVAESGTVTGNVLADNGAGEDFDPDGDDLTVSVVNNIPGAVGESFAVEGGGIAAVDADGALTFSTNGDFDDLEAGETATVTFDYVITDGAATDTGEVTITVTGAAPLTQGGSGADQIGGTSGADNIAGGGGNDTLTGGGGADTLSGQGGADNISGGGGGDVISGGGGRDVLQGNGGRDLLQGNGGRDMLEGGGGRDTLDGGGGRDELLGGGGRDLLQGGGGRDTLDGQGGRDTMEGGNGRDDIIGGRGADVLTGGGGADRFIFDQGNGRDTITDFQQNRDKIVVEGGAADFDALTIRQVGDNVLIAIGNTRVTVEDDEVGNFNASDFIF